MRTATKDAILTVTVLSICTIFSLAWYHIYVGPHEKVREQILDCMDGDRSVQAYETCHNKLNPRK